MPYIFLGRHLRKPQHTQNVKYAVRNTMLAKTIATRTTYVDMRKDFTNFLGACWFARSCHFQDFNLNASRRTYGTHHSHIDFSTVDYLGSGKLECEWRGGVMQLFIENLQVISNKNRRQRFEMAFACTKYPPQTTKLQFSHYTHNGHSPIPSPARWTTALSSKRYEYVWQAHVCQRNRAHVVVKRTNVLM